jgi:LacI family transcriptional regulator
MSQVKEPTIHEVAQLADVSISTVSLVMNGRDGVRSSTRDRVEKAARSLGYRPRASARSLASGTTGNVGFVLRDDHFTRSETFYTRVFLGSEFEARTAGVYVLLTTLPRAYNETLHSPRFLRERNVDGLLVAGSVPDAFLHEIEALRLPAVLIDYAWGQLPSVMVGNSEGAIAAATHLRERGSTRLAFCGADLRHPSVVERKRAFLDCAGDAVQLFESTGLATRAVGRMLGQQLCEAPDRPDAVFCANDALALGVIDAARECGIRVPDDLAVVGFDDVDAAAEHTPPLTTVRVFKEQLGETGLRVLSDLIGRDALRFDRGASTTTVAPQLIVRGTT